MILFQQFLEDYNLNRVNFQHKTYHHFTGKGLYDSQIDILLHSDMVGVNESLVEVKCIHDYPFILSHHDMIHSVFTVPPTLDGQTIPLKLLSPAPSIEYERVKIMWCDNNSEQYEKLVGPLLEQARNDWLLPSSQACMSILLQLTNKILISAAKETHKYSIIKPFKENKQTKLPKELKLISNKIKRAHVKYLSGGKLTVDGDKIKALKIEYRKAIRFYNNNYYLDRDRSMFEVMGKSPMNFYSFMRINNKNKQPKIEELKVGPKHYSRDFIGDGFYDAMSALKQWPDEEVNSSDTLSCQLRIFEHMIKLCQKNIELPHISLVESTNLINRVKKNVTDFYGISAQYYLNAGAPGLLHFNLLLNGIIKDVNNTSLTELNTVYGLILYKGHNKEKTNHRSYRTISTCPFLAKCIDLYVRDLSHELWDSQIAETQYQGAGSTHELAALMVTEAIQFSLYVTKEPVFLLALDAESAFDRCLPQILCNKLFDFGLPRATLNLICNRLNNRETIYEWDGQLMGPSKDYTGFEQGGINSSDFYKIYNTIQLNTANESELGVDLQSCVISAVGQADDVILMANDIYNLQLLAKLTESYCKDHRVKLEPLKTKLIAYSNSNQTSKVKIAEVAHNVAIEGIRLTFTDQLEHVGIIRHNAGNMPHILDRIAKHKRAIASVLFSGVAKSHRGNPAASIRIHNLYCTPVLMSGLASLVLTKPEISVLDRHFTSTLERLQKLHSKTPRSVIHFLSGTLPFSAHLAIRQLSLFIMICNKPNNQLHLHAKYILTFLGPSSKSWFLQIRNICQEYDLPNPLSLLQNPPKKSSFKKLVKLKVAEYWHKCLSTEGLSSFNSSIRYLSPKKCSLINMHPLWKFAKNNPYEVNKAIIVARMLSGRYRTESLSRFWSQNSAGYCEATTCKDVVGDLEHLLLDCPGLHVDRTRIFNLWLSSSTEFPPVFSLLLQKMASEKHDLIHFILNTSADHDVIAMTQTYGEMVLDHMMYLTRTFAYTMHKKKLQITGRWK